MFSKRKNHTYTYMGTLHKGRVRDPTDVRGSFVEVCLKISNSTKEWLQVMNSLKSFSCSPISIFLYWGNSQWKPKDIIKTKQKLEFCNVKILDRHMRAWTCNNSKLLTMKGHYVWYWKCSFLKTLIVNCCLSTPGGFPRPCMLFSLPFLTTTLNIDTRWS